MAKICFSIACAILVARHMGSNSVEASPLITPMDGGLLFDSSDLYDFEMPSGCEGKSFCFVKGDQYPEEKIAELLADMHGLNVENAGAGTTVGDRQGGDSYDEPDCPSNSTESPIYYITDEADRVRVVVQSKEKFLQIYTVTMCLNEGLIDRDTPHFLKTSHILKTFKMECVSTKMEFDFFVLSDEVDPITNKPKMEIARAKGGIPVCCRCRYNANDK